MFKPVSNTRIVPANGRLLIRMEINNFSKIMLVNKDKAEFNASKLTIEGTSHEDYPLNSEVLVDGFDIKDGMIHDNANAQCFKNISALYEELSREDKEQVYKDKATVDLVEYSLIRVGSVKAFINGK